MTSRPTLADLLAAAEGRLRAAGIADTAALETRYLAERAFSIPRAELRWRVAIIPASEQVCLFNSMVERRCGREPLQRILGRWEFWGLDLALGPETLIPRPDTETLVAAVLARRPDRSQPWRILDLGTGTGALLLALLHEYPAAWGVGVDVSPGAAAVAAGNAHRLGLSGRAALLAGDWAACLADGGFDLVVANPPYIPDGEIDGLEPEVSRHEPRRALAGGADGLDPYRHLAGELPRLLRPGGLAALEHGADQGPAVAGLLARAGLTGVETVPDLGRRDRVTVAFARS